MLPSLKEAGQILLTFFLVTIGWIIFRADSIGVAWDYLAHLFRPTLFSVPWLMTRRFYAPLLLSLCLCLLVEWKGRDRAHPLAVHSSLPLFAKFTFYLFLVGFIALASAGSGNQFIYFQF